MSKGVWLRGVILPVLTAICLAVASPLAGSAELTLSRVVWDFASIQQGDIPTQKIVLKNTGTDVVKILKTDLPAGFSAKPALADKEIPAGAELEVEFAFDSSAILGKLQQYAYIFLSDGKIVPLTMKGEVYAKAEPRLEVTPAEWDFGTVNVGESRQMSFRCKNTGTADLTVEKVQVYDPRFEVTRNITKETVVPGEEADFIISVNPKYAGKCETDFYLKSNSAGMKYTKISVSGYATAKTTGVIVSSDLSSVTNNTPFKVEVIRTDNLGREQTLMVNRESQNSFIPEPGAERPNPENYTLTIKLAKAVVPVPAQGPPPAGAQPAVKPVEGEGVEKPVPSPESEPGKVEETPSVKPEKEPEPKPEPPKEEASPAEKKPEETKPEAPTTPDQEKPPEPEPAPTEKPSPGEPGEKEPTVKPEKEEGAKPTEPETVKPPEEEKKEAPDAPPAPEPPADKPSEGAGSTNK